MIKPLGHTNLFRLAIQKVKQSGIPLVDFYVSVREPELVDIAFDQRVNVFERTNASAKAESDVGTMYEWYNLIPYKYVMLINPCLPFLKSSTIKKFYDKFLTGDMSSLFAVTKRKEYFWDEEGSMVTPWPEGQELLNTKAVGVTYEAAHALYGSSMEIIGEGKFMGDFSKGNPELFPISEEEAFDIDYPWQFEMARAKYEMQVL